MKLSECRMTFTEALESYLEAREVVQIYSSRSRRGRDAAEQMQVATDHLNAMTNLATVALAVRELAHYIPDARSVRDALNAL